MDESFEVGVVGTGYVGLVTGACLSYLGHQVVCIDRDEGRIDALKAGRMPFYEPGLEELLSRSLQQQSLSFADPGALVRLAGEAEVIFIAVDTPQGEDGSADLSNVARDIGWALAQSEAPRREHPLVVVNKSTVPPGSGNYVSMLVREGLEEAGSGEANFLVASNPEFLREGSAIHDSLFPDRIVVGSDSREVLDTIRALYEPLIEQSFVTKLDPRPKVAVPFMTTDLASAEMILEIAGSRSGIVHEPLPEDDPKQRRPDITRARETLGREPRVPAKEGLKVTFEWFGQRLNPSEAAPPAEQ